MLCAGQPHSLGPARGPAGARDHRDVVRRVGLPGPLASAATQLLEAEGARPAPPVQADQRGELRQLGADLRHQRRERRLEDQRRAVEELQQLAVLRRLVAGVHRAPHRPGPGDAEHAGERDRVVARQHRHLVARPDARAGQRLARPTRTAAAPRRSCGSARPVVRHGASGPSDAPLSRKSTSRTARTRRSVGPTRVHAPGRSCAARPSSSRWPNAWHPDANPARRGGCCSSEYAAYACSSAGLLVVAVAVDDAVRPAERAGRVDRVDRGVDARVLPRRHPGSSPRRRSRPARRTARRRQVLICSRRAATICGTPSISGG